MAKVPIKSFLLFCNRRSYAAAAAAAESTAVVQAAASAVRKTMDSTTTSDSKTEAAVKQKEVFWMKDPKTGNWIPEAHFDDTDVVALRQKFLPGRHPF